MDWGGGGRKGGNIRFLYRALWWGSDELYRDVTKIYGHARQQIMTVDGIVIGQTGLISQISFHDKRCLKHIWLRKVFNHRINQFPDRTHVKSKIS